jgi:hypothetical protein
VTYFEDFFQTENNGQGYVGKYELKFMLKKLFDNIKRGRDGENGIEK